MLRTAAKRGLTAVPGMACRVLKILGEIKLRKENKSGKKPSKPF